METIFTNNHTRIVPRLQTNNKNKIFIYKAKYKTNVSNNKKQVDN